MRTATGLAVMPVGGENASPEDCVAADYGMQMTQPVGGHGLRVLEPGRYWHYRLRSQVHFAWWSGPGTPPDPEPCGENDAKWPNPANLREPAPLGPNGGWYVSDFCNTVDSVRFTITAQAGTCSGNIMDRSNWPFTTYFNQYDAGERESLPRAADLRRGGNASGPAATMMAVHTSIGRDFFGDTQQHMDEFLSRIDHLGELPEVFDATMEHSVIEQGDAGPNTARPAKIAAFLQSLGYSDAKLETFGRTKTAIFASNRLKILKALKTNPVIVNTAFGFDQPWGKSGSGHVVTLRSLDSEHPLDYMVNDPGGNYFSNSHGVIPGGHYGPSECGGFVAYPMDWVDAYIPGRWMVSLGRPDGSRAPVGPTLRAAKATSAAAPSAAGGGQASIVLSAPVGAAPATFFLQDAEGRRTGFVDGQPVQEIPSSWAAEVNEDGAADGAVADDEEAPEDEPAGTTRALGVAHPVAGTTLHVGDAAGGRFAISEIAFHSGQAAAMDTVDVTVGPGGTVTPAAPALNAAIAGKAPVSGGQGGGTSDAPGGGTTTPGGGTTKPGGGTTTPGGDATTAARAVITKAVGTRRAVRVTVRCTGTAPCKVTLKLTVKRGRKTILVGTAKASVTGTKTVAVALNAAGRKRLRGHGKLVVKVAGRQDGKALKGARSVAARAR